MRFLSVYLLTTMIFSDTIIFNFGESRKDSENSNKSIGKEEDLEKHLLGLSEKFGLDGVNLKICKIKCVLNQF